MDGQAACRARPGTGERPRRSRRIGETGHSVALTFPQAHSLALEYSLRIRGPRPTGAHPNPAGTRIIAEPVAGFLGPMVAADTVGK
jgi:hypothetical protein